MPDDSAFCPFCGKDVIPDDVCPNCRHKLPDGSFFCPFCGSQVDNCEDVDKKRDIIQDGYTQNKQSARIVLPIISGVLGILVIVLSIVSFNLKSDNANLRNQIIIQKTEIDDLNSEIEKTKDSYNTLKKTSSRYYSNKQVVYLSQGNSKTRAFDVTCTFNTTCSYEYTAAKGSGTIKASWGDFVGDRAPFYITPNHQGIYNFKFTTTTKSSEYFNFLVIVD
ncbi:MAG: zinc ribbon domain-containing protein [Oscillospiraceae bacterium]|nr:zinc ribbon domain-containing protein [Oscillospiraceae bacterium]